MGDSQQGGGRACSSQRRPALSSGPRAYRASLDPTAFFSDSQPRSPAAPPASWKNRHGKSARG